MVPGNTSGRVTARSHKGSWYSAIACGEYNYDISGCHARTMASCARTRMLMNKRRFSKNILIDFFGGGIQSEKTKRIAVSAWREILVIDCALPLSKPKVDGNGQDRDGRNAAQLPQETLRKNLQKQCAAGCGTDCRRQGRRYSRYAGRTQIRAGYGRRRTGRRIPCHLIPTTIESGPAKCVIRVSRNPASFIHPAQSFPVKSNPPAVSMSMLRLIKSPKALLERSSSIMLS